MAQMGLLFCAEMEMYPQKENNERKSNPKLLLFAYIKDQKENCYTKAKKNVTFWAIQKIIKRKQC